MRSDVVDIVGRRSAVSLLDQVAAVRGHEVFIRTTTDEVISYERFAGMRDAVALRLRAWGVRQGDRVLVIALPEVPLLVTIFALHRLGAVAVMANTGSTPRDVLRLGGRTTARRAVVGSGLDEHFRALADEQYMVTRLAEVRTWIETDPAPAFDTAEWPPVGPDSDATTIFTSGTSAEPKAITFSHGNHVFAGEMGARRLGLNRDDRLLVHFPLFHINGLGQIFSVIATGSQLVLVERFRSGLFDEHLDRFRPTVTVLNSTHVKMIREKGTVLRQPSPLRVVSIGLALPRDQEEWFEEKYGKVIKRAYGLTETITSCVGSPEYGGSADSLGLPVPGYEIRLVRQDGSAAPVGEAGTALVRCWSPYGLMRGYDEDAESTAAVLKDGWLNTGDILRFDEQGFLYWVSREKEVIKRAGENISPLEIEWVLEGHPGISEAAVIGVPDVLREEVPLAFVVLRDGAVAPSEEQLLEFCRRELAAFKVPVGVRFLSRMPRTAVGKIEKRSLLDQLVDRA
jgi:crotonobetaine/carnitine-CoA ligase